MIAIRFSTGFQDNVGADSWPTMVQPHCSSPVLAASVLFHTCTLFVRHIQRSSVWQGHVGKYFSHFSSRAPIKPLYLVCLPAVQLLQRRRQWPRLRVVEIH
eukprot:scaffold142805_cov22-Tisochrysis_lutea.AAC.1